MALDAPCQIPSHRRRGLPPGRRGDRARRAGHGQRRDRDRSGPGRGRRRRRQRRRGRGGARGRARGLRGQQARGRGVDGARSATAADRRVAGAVLGALVSRRPAGHRHHRPHPPHQRRRARPPAHPSQLRGSADLPGGGLPPAGLRAGRAGAAQRRAARGWPHRPGAGAPPGRPERDPRAHRSTRVESARSSACARRSAIGCAHWNGWRSGPSRSARSLPAQYRRLSAAELAALSRAGTRARRGAAASSAARATRPPASR